MSSWLSFFILFLILVIGRRVVRGLFRRQAMLLVVLLRVGMFFGISIPELPWLVSAIKHRDLV